MLNIIYSASDGALYLVLPLFVVFQVLTAVGQGETLMQALQDAVPEDVREKLTTAISGIMQNQRSSLKFGNLLNRGHIPEMKSGLDSKIDLVHVEG